MKTYQKNSLRCLLIATFALALIGCGDDHPITQASYENLPDGISETKSFLQPRKFAEVNFQGTIDSYRSVCGIENTSIAPNDTYAGKAVIEITGLGDGMHILAPQRYISLNMQLGGTNLSLRNSTPMANSYISINNNQLSAYIVGLELPGGPANDVFSVSDGRLDGNPYGNHIGTYAAPNCWANISWDLITTSFFVY